MRIYVLDRNFHKGSVEHTEDGMGFHRVYVHWLRPGPDKPKDGVGFIASGHLLVTWEERDFSTEEGDDIPGRGSAVLRNYETVLSFNNEKGEYEVLSERDLSLSYVARQAPKLPFDPAGPYAGKLPLFYERTHHGDEFRRLTSQQIDPRIGEDGSVASGTYATTVNDLRATPSGLAAVGRYALPIKLPASYVYHIIPPPNTPILYSTVRPAYGFPGGGVEVYFPRGCPKGSAKLLSTLPEL